MQEFNDRLAVLITRRVATMWCAYGFALLALLSLRDNLDTLQHFIAWLSSQFLQLVLLAVIMVGQDVLNRQNRQSEDREA